MKSFLSMLILFIPFGVFANAEQIANEYSESKTPAELVASGWTSNNGDKDYKILQVVVKDSKVAAEFHIDKKGFIIFMSDEIYTKKPNFDTDYRMTATMEDWADMGTGKSGPMYHMSLGGLSFKGPMVEAMENMGPFAAFLINIGKNIQVKKTK